MAAEISAAALAAALAEVAGRALAEALAEAFAEMEGGVLAGALLGALAEVAGGVLPGIAGGFMRSSRFLQQKINHVCGGKCVDESCCHQAWSRKQARGYARSSGRDGDVL